MFSSGAFGQLSYVAETVRGTTPTTGNPTNLRMVKPSMKADIKTVKSAEIRPDRLSSGQTRVDQDITGGFDFELSAREYDPLFEGLFGSPFAHFGTLGLSDVFTCTTAAALITAAVATTGTSLFTLLTPGQWFKLIPPSTVSSAAAAYFADKWFKVGTGSTATTIVVDPSTPIAAPGLVTAVAGFKVSRSVLQNGSTRKTFTIQQAMTDVGQYLVFRGMEVNKLDLKIEVGSIITGSFDFIGASHDIQATTWLTGVPVASQTGDSMNAVTDLGSVIENGTDLLANNGSFIKSMSLSFDNSSRGQKAVGVFGNAGVGQGEFVLTGSMDVYFQDATYYKKWLNGTRTSISVGMADATGAGYMFDFDKVLFQDASLDPGSLSDDVILTLPFTAFYDPVSGRGVRVTRAIAA